MLRVHDTDGYDTIFYTKLQREEDVSNLTNFRSKQHKTDQNTFSRLTEKDPYPKISEPLSLNQAKALLKKDVTVLLDELSYTSLLWDIQCDNCTGMIEQKDGEEITVQR
jgi:hypothetical protein